jgi:hypothetical protein
VTYIQALERRESSVKRSLLALPVAALVLLATACTERTPGELQQTGAGTPTTGSDGPFSSTKTPSTGTATNSSRAPGPLADKKPCTFLSQADLSQIGLGEQEELSLGSARACRYQGQNFNMTIGIFDDLGLEDVTERTQLTPVKVGSHDAIRALTASGGCVFAIKTSNTSRVDVASAARADEQKACEMAKKVAEVVEPKLPAS